MTNENTDSERLQIEHSKLELDRYRAQLDHHKTGLDRYRPGFDAVIRFAELGIKSLLTLNGGAALALLTFMGHLEKSQAGLGKALMFFGFGAAASVLTAFGAYWTQAVIIETDDTTKSARWHVQALRAVTILVGVAGFAFFLCGLYIASQAISIS